MSTYYVYELWNPIKNLPFYVGKSKITKTAEVGLADFMNIYTWHAGQ